eukprot:GHVP01031300.1.p1 GENE.GHVP01031300.1~~GHVP01031300.1.p1  ORF type:complete len:629 (+),score=106.75 GHVP01031300.1:50-1936(+)
MTDSETNNLTMDVKLGALRAAMDEAGVDAYFIPTCDPHNSEYVAAYFARREWISGFTGSAGSCLVTKKNAYLWTDGRYFTQATQQLAGTDWTLMRQGVPGVPSLTEFVASSSDITAFGFDPFVTIVSQYETFLKTMPQEDSASARLVPTKRNLIDVVWSRFEPMRERKFSTPVRFLSTEYTGKSIGEKIKGIRESIKKDKAKSVLLTALDDIAWCFNLRGGDVDFNPVFMSYAHISDETAVLYTFVDRVEEHAVNALKEASVVLKDYDDLLTDLKEYCSNTKPDAGHHLIMMDNAVNKGIYDLVPDSASILLKSNPVKLSKAIKNEVELQCMRMANIRDTVALCRFLASLKEDEKNGTIFNENEFSLSKRLLDERKKEKHFVGMSFETISSIGGNCAVIHYRPEEKGSRQIENGQMYLVDSGGQYADGGTTDITRTVFFGEPTPEHRMAFTMVLKGHATLAYSIFPEGTRGVQLDTLARMHLWQRGMDYRHGTGHGVGAYLNVHEGPCGISTAGSGAHNETALRPGMIISNEPGYYLPDHYGIRIENLVEVISVESPNPHLSQETKYYGLKTISYAPIDKKLIETSLLLPEERNWVDNYHKDVYEKLAPFLQSDPVTLNYLKEYTQPL